MNKTKAAINRSMLFVICCVLLVSAIYFFSFPFGSLTVIGFYAVLLVVTMNDIAAMEIEDWCHIAILILGGIGIFTMPELSGLWGRVLGIFVLSVPMLIISLIVPGAFGGGDIKLMGAAGFFLGTRLVLIAMLFGVLLGGGYGIYLLLTKKKEKKDHFAFGPFLCTGMVLSLLFGNQVIEWYLSLLF